MLRRVLKKAASAIPNSLGVEVRKKDSRDSAIGVLRQARQVGLLARSVIDVGAAVGQFSLRCHSVFPEAKYVLVEPLEEYRPFLHRVLQTIPGTEWIQAALTKVGDEVIIHVHPDLAGSSVYLEDEDSNVNGEPRTVPAMSLDDITLDRKLEAPYLVKIDAQGAELDILTGGEDTLRKTEYLLLEVSCFEFFKGGPQFYDVITFMKSRGFVVYDVLGLQYRPLDNALSQIDLAFVKERGLFRRYHYFASSLQRADLNKRFQLPL